MKVFEYSKSILGRSPLGPPDTPNFEKFGEVVEVIILLYYLCVGMKKSKKCYSKKKKKIPMYYKTPIYVLESLSDSFSLSVLSSTLVPLRQQLK